MDVPPNLCFLIIYTATLSSARCKTLYIKGLAPCTGVPCVYLLLVSCKTVKLHALIWMPIEFRASNILKYNEAPCCWIIPIYRPEIPLLSLYTALFQNFLG